MIIDRFFVADKIKWNESFLFLPWHRWNAGCTPVKCTAVGIQRKVTSVGRKILIGRGSTQQAACQSWPEPEILWSLRPKKSRVEGRPSFLEPVNFGPACQQLMPVEQPKGIARARGSTFCGTHNIYNRGCVALYLQPGTSHLRSSGLNISHSSTTTPRRFANWIFMRL